MNLQHLRTIAWLRWRLACNQINRMGWANRAILYLLIILSFIVGFASLFVSIALGIWLLPPSWPVWMVFVWDGLILAFLGSWSIGVLTDLQRSEPLSLDKFLHLPVSPTGVFFLNYASSLLSLSLVIFFPTMLGWSLVVAWKYGGWLWLGPGMTLVFFVMVTALTYQFRGWLAAIMINKRRKRAILTALTVFVILLSQVPNILERTVFHAREKEREQTRSIEAAERRKLKDQLETGEIVSEAFDQRIQALDRLRVARKQREFAELLKMSRITNAFLPPLWLASGIDSAAHQRWPFAGLSLFGMIALASFGLERSYRTTLRLYRGGFEPHKIARREVASATDSERANPSSARLEPVSWVPNWLERAVPGANEQQASIAWMSFRNLTRAPEAKLALIAPVTIVIVVGLTVLLGDTPRVGPNLRPLVGLGICFFAMVGASQLTQNQFGLDRDGFRALLLAPVSERDILIGKNLALAPIAILLGLIALVAMQLSSPLHWSHFFATVFQLFTMYLVASLMGNLMSIVVPLGVAAGSLKPTNLKFGAIVLQLLIFLLAPLGMIPALIPLGFELLLQDNTRWNWLPIYFLGAFFYFVIIAIVYRQLIGEQAKLMAARKWKILETVTNISS